MNPDLAAMPALPNRARRTADQWPAHKAKARRQKSQRRALGREPRNGRRFQ